MVYNIMGYSRKIKTEGLRIYFFEKTLGIFHIFTLPLEIPDKKSSTPRYSTKLC